MLTCFCLAQSILEQFNPALENLVYLGNNYLRAFHGEWGPTEPGQAAASIPGVHCAITQDKVAGPSTLKCPVLHLSTLLLQDPLLLLGTDWEKWGALAYR